MLLLLILLASASMNVLYAQPDAGAAVDSSARPFVLKRIYLENPERELEGLLLEQDSALVYFLDRDGDIRIVQSIQVKRVEDLRLSANVTMQLEDGSQIAGVVTGLSRLQIGFKTNRGIDMQIPPDQIDKIDPKGVPSASGDYSRFDPNRTRLMFTSTGRALEAGEGYFSVVEVFFPMVAVGVTDWLSIAGGISLLPVNDFQILYGNLKVSPVRTEDLGISFGVLYLTIPSDDIGGGAGLVYGVGTYGSNDNAFTFGLGTDVSDDGFGGNLVLMLGGETRLSNSLKLVSENWIPSSFEDVFISGGLRFFGDNLAADFGLVTTFELLGDGGFPFLPWLGFAYNFGR
jgi:hypothetical protein